MSVNLSVLHFLEHTLGLLSCIARFFLLIPAFSVYVIIFLYVDNNLFVVYINVALSCYSLGQLAVQRFVRVIGSNLVLDDHMKQVRTAIC